eukprot:c20063_g1_i1 orf=240-842(+)
MCNPPLHYDLHEMLSLARDAAQVLHDSKDAASICEIEFLVSREASFLKEEEAEILALIEALQTKLFSTEQSLTAQRDGGRSGGLELLERQLEAALGEEQRLRREARDAEDFLDALKEQRQSIHIQGDAMKKTKTEVLRTRCILMLCAAVSHIIPYIDVTDRIAGSLIDKQGHAVETFDIDSAQFSNLGIRNKLWEMGKQF